MSLWSRLGNMFRPGSVERDLEAELRFHLEQRTAGLMAEGMTREAAAREAARRFGNRLRLREESRDLKLVPWLDSLVRDVSLAARRVRQNMTVTGAAVVSLALAMGACVAAFSLVDALILRPLPVSHPERLIYLAFPTYDAERPESDTFNDPLFVRLRDALRGRADLFAMSTQVVRPVTLADAAGEKEQWRTQFVSGDAFERLGVATAAGRLITGSDDKVPGGHPVAIVSHAFWMRRFGGDPAVVGRWFTMQDRQFQIVGVAGSQFSGVEPGRPTDVWLPYAMYNARAFGNRQFNWFRVFGRLNERVRIEQVQSAAQTVFGSFNRELADAGGPGSPERMARLVATPILVRSAATGPSPIRRQFERSLWILAAIAGLLWLIAGSNVANLFLARTAAREREMALRLSIGAGRSRLIQQVLVESMLVASAACALSLAFARLVAPWVVGMLASGDDPVQLDLGMDWRLVTMAGALTVLTTALSGLAPALRASSVAPMSALRSGGGRTATRVGVMRPFVAIQVAFGLVVLFVGGLLVLSFARLASVNPGFATANVLLLTVEAARPADSNEQRTALLNVLDTLSTAPGVQAVSSAESSVLGRAWTYNVRVPGSPQESFEATMAPVTPGFFETMNIPVRAGRAFSRHDMDVSAAVPIIVNEAFATLYFARDRAVGRTLEARFADVDDTGVHEVVGVVADTKYDLRKAPAPIIYIPLPLRTTGTVHVRMAVDAMAAAPRLREAVRMATPLLRVTSVTSQTEVVDRSLLRERLLALLAGFFALVGLVLVAVGLYGVLSYAVVQRTREIGIRVALGARSFSVVRTVLADIGGAALVGVAAGLAGGVYLSRFVEALLFEVTPRDFWSLALPLSTLVVAALLAALMPALRAARVDPVIAFRAD